MKRAAAYLLASAISVSAAAQPVTSVINYESSADGTQQPALWYAAPSHLGSRPLLVGLHFWGSGYDNGGHVEFEKWCVVNGWHFIYPHFRGPNVGPEATGSHLAIQDIVDAVKYARNEADVDNSRIYLAGASGGGHMALMMVGVHPEIWAGVSAWVPIADLTAWHAERRGDDQAVSAYAQQIEAACGGDPQINAAAAAECARRSPVTYLQRARGINLDINAGILDGHTGSVPVSHSLNAFNAAAKAADRISIAEIDYFTRFAAVPPWLFSVVPTEAGRTKPILFRRESGRVRVTLFEGGHEIEYTAALSWLANQRQSPSKRRAVR